MMRSLILILVCATAFAAQAPVVVDGALHDEIWRNAVVSKLVPAEPGVSSDLGGEIRLAVSGRYLYIGARMPEPTGRITARSMGKNPSWEEEDALRIVVGPYPDYTVQVGPLGAYSVETKGQPVLRDKFFAAALVKEREWTAEIAVPLNDLKPTRLDDIRMTIERVRAMRPGSVEQHWRWPGHEPAGKLPPGDAEGPAPVFRPALLGNREAPLEVGRGNQIPALDEGWNQGPWRDVPAWKLRRNDPLERFPAHETEVKLLHDKNALAVLARCADPAGAGEDFDIYLATSGSAYVHISIDPAGMLRQASGFTGGQQVARPRTEWKSSARGVARKESDLWMARIDIPLDEVAAVLGELSAPRYWRVLFERSRPAHEGEPREVSVLPVTQSETPLCPARYRRLELVEKARSMPEKQGRLLVQGQVMSAEQRKQLELAGMVNRQMRGRAIGILKSEREAWDQVNTVTDWERFRDPRVKALGASLGEFPARGPLGTRVTKVFPGDGYRREDLLYQSRPGFWVPTNLYLPAKPAGRIPGIILIHSQHRPRTQPELQDMGILWARAGAAVLIMDQIGAGERIENYPWNREPYHSRYIMGMQLYLIGESLMKWMVWDSMRAVDLLLERNDIDKNQIVLIGAVAGGGDPAAVTAALDPRISAVVPFNFGEASPENTRFVPEKNRWPLDLADPGWGGWETTRSLRGSIASQFLPWLICSSVAPRRFVYSFEMGWKVEDMPAWARYRKVFSLYKAQENLSDAHGFGPFPGPGECTNIGPAQRKSLYPTLTRWFGIPAPPREPEDRRPASELNALTPAIAAGLHAKRVHEIASETGRVEVAQARAQLAKLPPEARREWLQGKWAAKLGDIEPNRRPAATVQWTKPMPYGEAEGVTLEIEPGIVVPLLLLKPKIAKRAPVVMAIAEYGKEAILSRRREEIETLLKNGAAVCLPDVRGTGETAPDWRRGPLSGEISLAASELMLGDTLLGARLKDLRSVVAYLETRPEIDPQRIALWGEGLTPPNPPAMALDELPNWQIGPQIQQQAEPLGGLLALLGALYERNIHSVAIEGGLDGFLSILEDPFAYVPSDVIVPGILEAGDISDLAKALAPRPVLLENMRDGRNRVASHAVEAPHPAQWLLDHM
jgi:dienelactone hydrolase